MSVLIRLTLAVVVVAVWWANTDTPVVPVTFIDLPQPLPFAGAASVNTVLRDRAARFAEGNVNGPESVCFDSEGGMYASMLDGRIMRIYDNGWTAEYAYVGGRPLGAAFDKVDNLVVAEALKGLLMVERTTRTIVVLANRDSDGRPILYANALAIASDGKIYFTDSTDVAPVQEQNGAVYSTMRAAVLNGLEGKRSGRLLVYDPSNPAAGARVIARDFHYANGVALSIDESFVVVAETFGFRLHRHWLTGAKAGTTELFARLPAMPDGVERASDGGFWVALLTGSVPDIVRKSVLARQLVLRLPRWMLPAANAHAMVGHVSIDGTLTQTLHDPSGETIDQVTSVAEHGGQLFLGNLKNKYLGVYPLGHP